MAKARKFTTNCSELKIDWQALEIHVQQYPEATLKDRATQFAVNPSAIWYALKELQITRKKQSLIAIKCKAIDSLFHRLSKCQEAWQLLSAIS